MSGTRGHVLWREDIEAVILVKGMFVEVKRLRLRLKMRWACVSEEDLGDRVDQVEMED